MNDKPVYGRVDELICMPHRTDIVVRVDIRDRIENFFLIDGGEITWDGMKCNTLALFGLFMNSKHGATVMLHPRIDRYGASTEAEFTSIEEEGV